MWTYLFLGFIAGLGVFLMVNAASLKPAASQFNRIEQLQTGELKVDPNNSFWKNWRKHGVDVALYQAELDVTRIGFMRTGVFISGAAAAVLMALTGSPIVAVAGFFVGFIFYVRWLHQRRDDKRLEYEEAISDLCDRLASGAQQSGNVAGALEYATALSPQILQADLNIVMSKISMKFSTGASFQEIQRRRNSYALNILVDTLSSWERYGTARPLHEILAPLATAVRERSSERKLREAELSGARTQMTIVAVAPFFFVMLMRGSSEEFASFYSSMDGQIMQVIGYAIAAFGFMLGDKVINSVRKTMSPQVE